MSDVRYNFQNAMDSLNEAKVSNTALDAAIKAGAPKDIIGWIDQPSVALSNQLMTHDKINLI